MSWHETQHLVLVPGTAVPNAAISLALPNPYADRYQDSVTEIRAALQTSGRRALFLRLPFHTKHFVNETECEPQTLVIDRVPETGSNRRTH